MRKKRHAQANVTQSFGHRGDKQEVCSLQRLPFHYECVRGAKLFCHVCQRRTLVQRSDQQFSKNVLPTCVIAFVCLHAASIVLGKSHPNAASYPFLILAPTLSCAGSPDRGISTTGRARTGWLLFASALLLWMAGISLSCWEDVADHVPEAAAWFSDFSYFLYGAPLLVILSLPSASERVPLFLWLDAIQGALTVCRSECGRARGFHPRRIYDPCWTGNFRRDRSLKQMLTRKSFTCQGYSERNTAANSIGERRKDWIVPMTLPN